MPWYLFGHSHKWSEFQLLSECLSQLLYSQWFLYILLLYVHFSEVFIIYNIYPTVFENLCFSFYHFIFTAFKQVITHNPHHNSVYLFILCFLPALSILRVYRIYDKPQSIIIISASLWMHFHSCLCCHI